ncbi:prepilin peptidase [Enterobacter cloacae]|uniref:prepilin peptidase n=1 Tax=Enterobacter cloacae TaxID=550 RepID=UPI003D9FB3A3
MEAFFTPWYPWLALLLGGLIGSFLNVIIYRLPIMLMRENGLDEEKIVLPEVNLWWPPSHCPRCQHTVMPWDNIPVVSWLLLRGKCRYCRCAISAIYPLSEALIGVVFWGGVFFLYPQYSLGFVE